MYRVSDWYKAIDSFAPFSTAFEGDNSGLLVGSKDAPADRALLALDLTDRVVDEAAARGIALIITHHPVIFSGIKKLPSDSIPYRLAAGGLSAICAHTNLDISPMGVNDALAKRLNLKNVRPFLPKERRAYYKLVVFVPEERAETVYDAMAKAGAGNVGNYSGVAFLDAGEGRFVPMEGARPAVGTLGGLESVREIRIEMLVPPDRIGKVVSAVKAVHPYEEVAFDVFEDHAIWQGSSLGQVGDLEAPVAPEPFAIEVKRLLGASGVRMVAAGAKDGVVIAANVWGKLKTVLQMVTIILYYALAGLSNLHWLSISDYNIKVVIGILCWLVAAVTALSGIQYIWSARHYVNTTS